MELALIVLGFMNIYFMINNHFLKQRLNTLEKSNNTLKVMLNNQNHKKKKKSKNLLEKFIAIEKLNQNKNQEKPSEIKNESLDNVLLFKPKNKVQEDDDILFIG